MESKSFGVIKKIYNTIINNYEDLDGPKEGEFSYLIKCSDC